MVDLSKTSQEEKKDVKRAKSDKEKVWSTRKIKQEDKKEVKVEPEEKIEQTKPKIKNPKDLEFHALEWLDYHEEEEDEDDDRTRDSSDSDNDSDTERRKPTVTKKKLYTIRLFGRTLEKENSKSVFVKVTGYQPYFYIEIPDNWTENHVKLLMSEMKRRVAPKTRDSLVDWKITKAYKFRGFTNKKKFKFVQFTFRDMEGFRKYEWAFRRKIYVKGLPPSAQLENRKATLYESNIDPILRMMHIQNLEASGIIKIKEGKYHRIGRETLCDINVECKYKNLEASDEKTIAKLKVAAFDIECTSTDGSFPQPEREGDKIIQIGTTFSYYGEDECYYKHIVTLGTCDPIKDVEVVSCKTEAGVLLAWKKMLDKMDPDIVIGYNIFGFDEKYMWHRGTSKFAKCDKFRAFSRIRGEISDKLKEKKLSSSALGDNLLYYFDMKGRVQVDLMKVVMRDYKLSSYKLDYAVAYFIREKVEAIEIDRKDNRKEGEPPEEEEMSDVDEGCHKVVLKTKSTKGLKEGNYITLNYNDGISDNSYREEKKFLVKHLTETEIHIEEDDDHIGELKSLFDRKYKVEWNQSKDDLKPKDIFRLQELGSKDRAKIAKYCIQDCALCNRLFNKLQVLNNNVGMANVCSVPLSYLFLRGQTVKSYSLVAKFCRKEGYLIPVLDKVVKKEGEEESSFEGACVFDPKPGVYFEPIVVLDYSSLYPKSIIHRNLSHECIVIDPKYDNLPGYFYFEAEFKNSDGTTQKCRYAHPHSGERGIMPRILMGLLDAREATKDKMKLETDPFKKKILDGLQSSFKISANSLYGLIGSDVSPIYFKEIAASVTATGRDMLQFARKIVEENFKGSEIIYGDSVLGDEPLIVKDKDGTVEIKTIEELSNKWKEYKNYKDGSYNEYFMNIVRTLIKNIKDIKKIKKEDATTFLPITEWMGGKCMGSVYPRVCSGTKFITVTVRKKGIVNKIKSFSCNKYDEKEAYELANASLKELNVEYGLIKNQYRKIKNMITDEEYLEVKLTNDKIMICDVDDLDIVNEGIWYSDLGGTEYYAKACFRINKKKCNVSFHKKVIEKMLLKLPEALREKFKNHTIDHVNTITLDNRKSNLRFATKTEQSQNRENFKYNKSGVKGVYKHKSGKWVADYPSTHYRHECKYFDTKEEAIEERKKQEKRMRRELQQKRNEFIEELRLLLIDDQRNRDLKEQSKTDYKVWTDEGWKQINRVIRHKTNKKLFRIITRTSVVDVTEDHSLINENGEIIKPKDCQIGTKLLTNFPKNFNPDIKTTINKPIFANVNKKECLKYYYSCKRKGYNVKLSVHNNNYMLERTNQEIQNPNEIIKIIPLDDVNTDTYVYDLETENGHFHAGIGELIVHNTDSIFIKFKILDENNKPRTDQEGLRQAIALGKKAAEIINSQAPYPQKINYEKTMHPLLIIAKKRYVGNLYEDDHTKMVSIKSMGIETKRRDNAGIVKEICAGIIHNLMNERSIEKAVKFVKKTLIKVLNGKVSLEKFTITKTLRGHYKNPEGMAHCVLAERMGKRDLGTKPQVNDRIPFAFVRLDDAKRLREKENKKKQSSKKESKKKIKKKPKNQEPINGLEECMRYFRTAEEEEENKKKKKGKPKVLQGDKIEHIDYIKEHKDELRIDYLHYITNQIMKPAMRFLSVSIKEPKKLFQEIIYKEVSRRERESNRRKGIFDMKNWVSKPVDGSGDFGFTDLKKKVQTFVIEKPNRRKKSD
jgi:DNA polymerase elongation subunit (family B)